ncbi:hypothetical protein L0P88_18930 [Muricauda sp. SCSIO 64092]|uniref:hypothetical protein n=1 Tax=Allomuricauda sp. SCSIO 64092 TaxID=2908842 RepID=UPI001FF25945|nr:hypothetical protein [Muricauda sp. SCSIO 64092]UOY05997.1 hypothetical protein L0P88_18930 [Muricauda sp. SCSIO 64092]
MQNSFSIIEFEQLSLSEKIDFLDENDVSYNFEDKAYFIKFIKKNIQKSSDYWIVSSLVDLASDLKLEDNELFDSFMGLLVCSNHYLIKLSVLDFQVETYDIYYSKRKSSFDRLRDFNKRIKERLIVRNQMLMNLMLYDKENRLTYLVELLENLKRTMDYRSHMRVFNMIINHDFFSFMDKNYISRLLDISEGKFLGKAVEDKINELKNIMNGTSAKF